MKRIQLLYRHLSFLWWLATKSMTDLFSQTLFSPINTHTHTIDRVFAQHFQARRAHQDITRAIAKYDGLDLNRNSYSTQAVCCCVEECVALTVSMLYVLHNAAVFITAPAFATRVSVLV